jgi:hypothetical protein
MRMIRYVSDARAFRVASRATMFRLPCRYHTLVTRWRIRNAAACFQLCY